MDQSTPEQHAEIRRAAVVRRDYVVWLAKALEQRAAPKLIGYAAGAGFVHDLSQRDRDLLRTAAAELRALISAGG